MMHVSIQILLILLAATAMYCDVRERRIPNWLSLTGVVAGFAANAALSGVPGLWFALKGMGLALAVYFPLFALRAMGAGDAKLMAAVGALAGWANWLGIMILTAIFGGLLAVIAVVRKGRVKRTASNLGLMLLALRMREAPHRLTPDLDVKSEQALRLPHGVPIALGVLAFLGAAAIWGPR